MATVTGATSGVTQIPQNSSGNGVTAQTLLNTISTINGGSQFSGTSLSLASLSSITTPVVVGIGGTTPTNAGTVTGTLTANVVAVVVNNTAPTTLSDASNGGNLTVVAGNGGLTFTDVAAGTTVDVGGGSNSDAMSGFGDTFTGDGSNTITLAGASRGVADSVIGTTASSDTITGTAGATVPLVYTDGGAGSKALINPTAGNVTIIGNGGAESVYGGTGANAFTGSLTVTNGNGFFIGGTAGSNAIASGTVGGSTLIGGGANDTLVGGGSGDILVGSAGSGAETLSGAGGNETLRASLTPTSGADLMYGSSKGGNEFDLGASTVAGTASTGVIFKGDYISMHLSPTGQSLGTVSNTIVVSGSTAEFGSVLDFISGTDKVLVAPGQGNVTLIYHPNGAGQTVLATASGTTVAFLSKISASDVTATGGVVTTFTLSS